MARLVPLVARFGRVSYRDAEQAGRVVKATSDAVGPKTSTEKKRHPFTDQDQGMPSTERQV